jgi:hypothetical protein
MELHDNTVDIRKSTKEIGSMYHHLVQSLLKKTQQGNLIARLIAFTGMGGVLALVAIGKGHWHLDAMSFLGIVLLGMFFGAFTGVYLFLWDGIKAYAVVQPTLGALLALGWMIGLAGGVIGVIAIIIAVFSDG